MDWLRGDTGICLQIETILKGKPFPRNVFNLQKEFSRAQLNANAQENALTLPFFPLDMEFAIGIQWFQTAIQETK